MPVEERVLISFSWTLNLNDVKQFRYLQFSTRDVTDEFKGRSGDLRTSFLAN